MRSGVCPASPRVPSATATRSRAGRRTAVTKRNLRPLGRPHNLVNGRNEVAHDGRAEDARLRDVRAPRARLHQDAASPEGTRRLDVAWAVAHERDRKSTRLNSSHLVISYAVFCLKKKKKEKTHTDAAVADELRH